MKRIFLFAAICFATSLTVQGSKVAKETVFNTDDEFSVIDNAIITQVVVSDYRFRGSDFDVCAVKVENIVFDFARPVLNGIEPKFDFGFTRPLNASKHRHRCNDPPNHVS